MSDGMRDAFIENDVVGNYNLGSSFIGASKTRTSRKKSRKHRKKSKSSKSIRRKRKHYPKHSRKSKSKRKGMSAAFLKNLRRKHGLGEFKK